MDFKKHAAIVALATVSSFVAAKDTTFGIIAGLGVGGDVVYTAEFDDGSDEDITAGSGVLLGAFAKTPLSEENNINLKLSFSYMFDSVDARNGSVSFNRFPINLLVQKDFEKFNVGAGITYHLSPELEIDTPTEKRTEEADDALGFILDAGYIVNKDVVIGARLTSIEYDNLGVDGDGSGIFVYVDYGF